MLHFVYRRLGQARSIGDVQAANSVEFGNEENLFRSLRATTFGQVFSVTQRGSQTA
jgi:hypothetical protein